MSEKIIGYLLLIFGIIIIIFSLFGVYKIFKSKVNYFTIFNLPGISLDLTELINTDLSQEQIEQLKNEKGLKTDLIPSEIINNPLNLIANMIFFMFSLNVGYKISQLGIQLLRPIKVSLKENIINKKEVNQIE